MPLWFLLTYLALWVLFVLHCMLTLALLRQVGILNLRILPVGARTTSHGPDIGEPAPAMELPDMDDAGTQLRIPPIDGRNWLLLFMSPMCPTCKTLVPSLKVLHRQTGGDLGWAVVLLGPPPDCEEFRLTNGLEKILFCHGPNELRDLYQIGTTPYAFLIAPDARVLAKGVVNQIEHLESLLTVNEVLAGRAHLAISNEAGRDGQPDVLSEAKP